DLLDRDCVRPRLPRRLVYRRRPRDGETRRRTRLVARARHARRRGRLWRLCDRCRRHRVRVMAWGRRALCAVVDRLGFGWERGRPLIGIVGAAVLVGGVGLLVWALIGEVDREVSLPQQEKRLIRPIARYGIAGRGAVVALVGCFLIAASLYNNPREAHEVG